MLACSHVFKPRCGTVYIIYEPVSLSLSLSLCVCVCVCVCASHANNHYHDSSRGMKSVLFQFATSTNTPHNPEIKTPL